MSVTRTPFALDGRCPEVPSLGLTAKRFFPLPFESSFSALLRLSWANVFSRRDLAEFVLGWKFYIPPMGFIQPDWIDVIDVDQQIGWVLPSSDELIASSKFGDLANFVEGVRLRYCPVCLECFYHSYWFQFINLCRCPIHGCKLETTCMSCGAPSPSYDFAPKNFKHPFLCSLCSEPLAGSPIDIALHQDFRSHSSQIRDAFIEYQEWVIRFDREKFNKTWVKYQQSEWQDWCRVDPIKSHFVQIIEPMPQEIAPRPYRGLCILSWNIEMNHMRFNRHPIGSLCENGTEMACVVCVVLRRLKRWIWGLEKGCEFDFLQYKFDQLEWPINPQEWSPRELAYFILRGTHSWMFGPRLDRFEPLNSWKSRIPRVAFCAYLYGLYAGLYHAISAARCRGIRSWHKLERFYVRDYLLMRNDISLFGFHSGIVIFPNVHGLPIPKMFDRVAVRGVAGKHDQDIGMTELPVRLSAVSRVEEETEMAVLAYATEQPAHGPTRTSKELRQRDIFVSPSGVYSIWLRNDLATLKQRRSALEKLVARHSAD